MINVIDALKIIYPAIEGGFTYSQNRQDGTEWESPIDGLTWENTEFEKPTWEQIESALLVVDLEEAKNAKKAEINAQRDANMAKDTGYKIYGVDHYFQRNIAANLAWVTGIEGSTDSVPSYDWITANNEIVSLSKNDLINICSHIRDRDNGEAIQARKRKDAVLALTTIAEVEAFDITQVFE